MSSRPIITLTTDFGSGSSYVAQLKGVLLQRLPAVQLVDICHEIGAQQIDEAGWVIEQAFRYFPPETCHLVVVDPGVGTARRILMLRVAGQLLMGPDNGLFTRLLTRHGCEWVRSVGELAPTDHRPAPTFHGRDLMAPLLAQWLSGRAVEPWGSSLGIDQLVTRDLPQPVIESWGAVGQVDWVDRFGNLVTNLEPRHLQRPVVALELGTPGVIVDDWVETYGQRPPGTLVGLVGSTGFVEVAEVNGHAANRLSMQRGARVVVRW